MADVMLERCFYAPFRYRWLLREGLYRDGYATTRHGALRAARKAYREEQQRRSIPPEQIQETVVI